MNVQYLYDIIEKGIAELGIEPENARGEKEGQWDFNRGSASIAVGVSVSDRFPKGYFYCTSVLMSVLDVLPSKKEEFYYELLKLNSTLVNMQLSINEDWVLLLSNRSAEGLDIVEVAITINELSYFADELDDLLINGFCNK